MRGRRSNSEGSITRRSDGRWMARVSLANGDRKTFYAKTRQEALQLLKAAIRDLDKGLPLLSDAQMLGQYLETWLAAVQHTIKPGTWKRHAEYVRLHIIPDLGKVPLTKLTAQQVQALYAKKLDEGLSPTTVHHLHAVLHRALKVALRLELLQRNVTEMVDPPRMAHPEMATLSAEQARHFLATAAGDRFEALYVLALCTGMRQGELLALRWRDIDLPAGTVSVRATLRYSPQGYVFAEPKTHHSRRLIALPQLAQEALKRHKQMQAEEKAKLGDGWRDVDLVFPNTIGGPMVNMHLLRREFLPMLEKAGLRRIRFHDLRHTAATLLLGQGVNPKIVSEMLGHSDVSITLNLYSHVTPHMQQQAAAAMDDALGT
jgi:integrase